MDAKLKALQEILGAQIMDAKSSAWTVQPDPHLGGLNVVGRLHFHYCFVAITELSDTSETSYTATCVTLRRVTVVQSVRHCSSKAFESKLC